MIYACVHVLCSHMCALHEALCKELSSYSRSPPEAGRRLINEKKRAWFGTGDAVAMERMDVAQHFFHAITRIVEVRGLGACVFCMHAFLDAFAPGFLLR